MPCESAGEGSGTSHPYSGSKSQRPTKRLSARERKARNKKNTIKTSLKNSHDSFTHFPKDPLCPIGNKTKMQKARSSSYAGSEEVPLKNTKAFGDLMTLDYKVNVEKGASCPVFNDESGKGNHTLVILNYFTQWAQAYPVPSKD